MNLGHITTQPCLTDPRPPDPRCVDPAFALANPDICPAVPRLIIRPSFALACALGSVQFKASYIDEHYIETDVTDQTTFQSSDMDIAVVGASSGNATGLSTGEASITGTYQTLSSFAKLTVLGADCCEDQNVAMMVMVDRTRSMKSPFSAGYATKLDFAKAAAQRFISEVNGSKDLVGLMQFTALGYDVLSSPVADKDAVAAMVAGITQTQQLTRFYDPLTAAIAELNVITSAELKVIVLITDGEDKDDSYSTADNPVSLLQEFKDAGGIVLCIGVRAHDFGYNLLQAFSTGGFFLNGHDASAEDTLDFMMALKGYICASNCAPDGDVITATGTLNYCGLANWNVVDGHVDLLGNGFLDLLPGNGLYLDLAGSRSAYKGRIESKDSYAIEDGKTYRIKLRLAGNQRVDATPNTITVKAFARNTDSIADPTVAPTVGAASGSGSATLENYDYAYSYVNANGETPLSPVATGDNGSFETFSATVTATASAEATLVRFYKRETGTDTWYRVAESDPDAPSFEDTLSLAAIVSGLADGTIDSCDHPVEENTTATPIVLFEQDITIDDFTQDFTEYNLSFDAPQDANVWLSIQQTETPTGYDAIGLLLDSVTFENDTDTVTLLEDDFDTENMTYVPPGCGIGTTYVQLDDGSYGYMTGFTPSDCCYYYTTPGVGAESLVPEMTDNNVPEGFIVSMGSIATTNEEDWHFAFNTTLGRVGLAHVAGVMDPATQYIQLQFLVERKIVRSYSIKANQTPPDGLTPTAWTLRGSNNGSTWTILDTRSGITGWGDTETKTFNVASPAAYSYYRLVFTATEGADTSFVDDVQFFGSGPDVSHFADNCEECPTETPGVQSPDPNPVLDNETTEPPEVCERTTDVVRSCATGYLYVPDTALEPVSTTVSHCETASPEGLDGLRWEMKVLQSSGEFHGSICPVGVTGTFDGTGKSSCDPADQSVVLRGNPGTTYNVTLRFRGIVERQHFAGVEFAGTNSTFVQLPSFPGITGPGNAYYLITSNPSRVYALNSVATADLPTWACYKIDYTVTIPLNAAATVSLLARSRDHLANKNLVLKAGSSPATYSPGFIDGIVNDPSTLPALNPFPGQFIQMDVVSISIP